LAKQRYFPTTSEKELLCFLADKHIAISTTDRMWFSESEKKDALDYWETYQQELFSKIHLRWTYSGPVEFVKGKEFADL